MSCSTCRYAWLVCVLCSTRVMACRELAGLVLTVGLERVGKRHKWVGKEEGDASLISAT